MLQEVTDGDLVAGLGLLADSLHKPSLANDVADDLEIPEKFPRQSTQELPVATVAVPTAMLMPCAAESQFVTSSAATNQAGPTSDLSAADWQTLVEATPTEPLGQCATVIPACTSTSDASEPATKKVVLLVVKRPLRSTASQSRSGTGNMGSYEDSTTITASSNCTAVLNNFLVSSSAEANSMVPMLTTLHTDLCSQELVTRSSASSGHLHLLEGNLRSPEGHLGSLGHLGSSLQSSELSTVDSENSVLLRHVETEAQGQEMVDEDEVQTPTSVNVDHQAVMTQLKQFLNVSDLYQCS